MKQLRSHSGFSAFPVMLALGAIVISVGLYVNSSTIQIQRNVSRQLSSEALHEYNHAATETAAQLLQSEILIDNGNGNVTLRPPSGEPIAQQYRWFHGREPSPEELEPKLKSLLKGEKSFIELSQEVRAEAQQSLGPIKGGDAAISVRALYRTLLARYPTTSELEEAIAIVGNTANANGLPTLADQLAAEYQLNRSDISTLHLEPATEYQNEFFYASTSLQAKTRTDAILAAAQSIAAGNLKISLVRNILLGLPHTYAGWYNFGIGLTYQLMSAGACGQNAGGMVRSALGAGASPEILTGLNGLLVVTGAIYNPYTEAWESEPGAEYGWYTRGPTADPKENGCNLAWLADALTKRAPIGTNSVFIPPTATQPSIIEFKRCHGISGNGSCPERSQVKTSLIFESIGTNAQGKKAASVIVSSQLEGSKSLIPALDRATIAFPSDSPPPLHIEVRSSPSYSFGTLPITIDPANVTAELRWSAPPSASQCTLSPMGRAVPANATQSLSPDDWKPTKRTTYIVTCKTDGNEFITSNSVTVNVQSSVCEPQDTITFQTLPFGTPSPGYPMSSHFEPLYGVRFIRAPESGGKPQNNNGSELGQSGNEFFLFSGNPITAPTWVQYSSAVSQASGFIVNVDPASSVQVIAKNWTGLELGRKTILGSEPNASTSQGVHFSFQRPSQDISYIEFVGSTPGFGVDNFSPYKICSTPPNANPTPLPSPTPFSVVSTGSLVIRSNYMPTRPAGCSWGWGTDGVYPPGPLMSGLVPGQRLYASDVWGNHIYHASAGQWWDFYESKNKLYLDARLQFKDASGNVLGANRLVKDECGGIPLWDFMTNGVDIPAGAVSVWGAFWDEPYYDNDGFATAATGTSINTGGVHLKLHMQAGAPTCNRNPSLSMGTGFNNPVLAVLPTQQFLGCAGSFYVAGQLNSYKGNGSNAIMRISADGEFDPTFNVGFGFNNQVLSLAPTLDGSRDILAIGPFTRFRGQDRRGIVRIKENGSIEFSFNPGSGFTGGTPTTITPVDDGSLSFLVGGNFTSYQGANTKRFAWLNSDGSLRTSFKMDRNGASTAGFDGSVNSVLFHSGNGTKQRGEVYVGGDFQNYDGTSVPHLVRLYSNGCIDHNFSARGKFNGPVQTVTHSINYEWEDPRHLYVGGSFTTFNGATVNGLVRLIVDTERADNDGNLTDAAKCDPAGKGGPNDGQKDPSFNLGSGADIGFKNTNGPVVIRLISPFYKMAGASREFGIIVAGEFTHYRGTPVGKVVRINSDGSLVTTFLPQFGTGTVHFAVPMPGQVNGLLQNIYVGGSFMQINSSSANHFGRIDSNGNSMVIP